ncbi:MAG: 2Fe-2S iron-sulfur cluster-binding protein [Deltaproteobacteria bacterium]|nr:2Fe-2S iron-sulfur cluster-binding protein [Deltaproteobacteria bacterium]
MKAKAVHLYIDGKEIECSEGERILWTALGNGIYIPNLCAMREKTEPYGACRLCFVEVEGEDLPVPACTTKVKEGMVVNTKGAKALRLARTAFELILSNHPVDCAHCLKSGACELQKISKHLGVKLSTKRFKKFLRDLPIDETSPVFTYDPNKCVLCGKCVWLCQEKLGTRAIGFAYRGFQRWVTTFDDEPVGVSECRDRIELAEICPVGAFVARNKWNKENTVN